VEGLFLAALRMEVTSFTCIECYAILATCSVSLLLLLCGRSSCRGNTNSTLTL